MGGLDTFKDFSFLMKFIAMIVNIVTLLMWTATDKMNIPVDNKSELILFYHANAGYIVILIGFVILYFLDEPPGQWAQRLFILTGSILFLVSGIIGLYYTLKDDDGSSYELIVAILLVVDGVLLMIDFIKSEQFC